MTDEEKIQLMSRILGNGNTRINQFFMDNHGTVTIHNHAENEPTAKRGKKEMPSPDQIARAIMKVQDKFWANSSYAVLFCVFRDCYLFHDNRSQYEREMTLLPCGVELKYSCTPGVVSSTMNDNKYMELPIDKWKSNKAPERVLTLVESFKNALDEVNDES